MGQARTHSAHAVFVDKKTELLIYHWNSSNWWQQLRFNFSKTELIIDLKARNQRKEEKCCTGKQNYFDKQFTWLFSLRRGNSHQWSNSSTVLLQNHLDLTQERWKTMDISYSFEQFVFLIFSLFYSKFSMWIWHVYSELNVPTENRVTSPLNEQRQDWQR